ncbi:MAG TPA: nucleotidyl transferase AbiEii/AbiGii toxin family protein [Solirubrobacteraceae bacterium]|nr:nucleotidyl transferase AbiEii/AbiGii toxin family protein [Solirubrobacteraceae bacterium]
MTEPSLPEKIVAIHERLRAARIRHAFGGALALAYYAEPRATIDIDLNVFLPPADHARVGDELAALGIGDLLDVDALEWDGQCRVWWGRTPLDLFFASEPIHDAMRHDIRTVPFGDQTIPVLAPEHLAVCKVVFDRPKDWLDIEQMLISVEQIDVEEIDNWLAQTLGDDPRKQRFDQLAQRLLDR